MISFTLQPMKSLAKDADANQNIHTTVGKQEINLFSKTTYIAMSQMTFTVYLNIYRSIVKRIQSRPATQSLMFIIVTKQALAGKSIGKLSN
jgi:hypothetical protein